MKFPSVLTQATLMGRFKRFLAEVVVNNLENRLIYCPNLGPMKNCNRLGSRVWFSFTFDPKRQFPSTWELIEVDGGHLVCINPQWALPLIIEGIQKGVIEELQLYPQMTQGANLLGEHAFDLKLEKTTPSPSTCFVCLQSVTLGDEIHRGFYPDGLSDKSVQQLRGLIQAKQLGHRSILLYCVLHSSVERVFPADHIDLQYGYTLRQAIACGVEVLAYRVSISLEEITLIKPIEVCIPARLISSGF